MQPVRIYPAPQTSGSNKTRLNEYVQSKILRSVEWLKDDEKQDFKRTPGFRSFVEVELPNGQKVNADSQNYYPSKIASREVAASNVIKAIGPLLTGACKHADQSLNVSKAPSSTGKRLICKEKLNNELHGNYHTNVPKYSTLEVGEQLFQCTISHHLFGTVTGSCCKSKRQAEDSAAKLALDRLKSC